MKRAALIQSRAYLLSVALIALLSAEIFLTGCSGELDASRPQDSYLLFRDALFDGDGEGVWERTDDRTREYFEEHVNQLKEMNDLIERYLPITDHQLARRQSGVEILDQIEDGRQLFLHIFSPSEVPDDHAIRFGSDVREIRMAEDGESAIIVTRGEQEFSMLLQDDGLWYVNLAESGDYLDQAFQWLAGNKDALEQTVEDLINEERQVRERIIAELLDLDLDE